MIFGLYPRKRVEARLVREAIPAAHRIMWLVHIERPLAVRPFPSRFCDGVSGYAVIYAAPKFQTAFIETVRDRFVRKANREIPLGDLLVRCWTKLATKKNATLTLLDLRGSGCLELGAPTDVVSARNHAAGRAFGRAIYREHDDVDGFVYPSRLTGFDCYAIFERGVPKLTTVEVGELRYHEALPNVLHDHGIRLIDT